QNSSRDARNRSRRVVERGSVGKRNRAVSEIRPDILAIFSRPTPVQPGGTRDRSEDSTPAAAYPSVAGDTRELSSPAHRNWLAAGTARCAERRYTAHGGSGPCPCFPPISPSRCCQMPVS